MEAAKQQLQGCGISYSGSVKGGIELHSDLLIYPVGSALLLTQGPEIKSLTSDGAKVDAWTDMMRSNILLGRKRCQEVHPVLTVRYLQISCLGASRDGRFVAVGKATTMGMEAELCLWVMADRKMTHRCTLHKASLSGVSQDNLVPRRPGSHCLIL